MGVKSTDFDLADGEKQELLRSGQRAARSFLSAFDFYEYRRTWRSPG
jgi:hypothetical protein